jgi:hypothetical protein
MPYLQFSLALPLTFQLVISLVASNNPSTPPPRWGHTPESEQSFQPLFLCVGGVADGLGLTAFRDPQG